MRKETWDNWVSQVALVVKNSPVNAGASRDVGSTPRSGISPGVGNGNPLQDSCLGIPMDREAWGATVHGVAKSWTRLMLIWVISTRFKSNNGQQCQYPVARKWYLLEDKGIIFTQKASTDVNLFQQSTVLCVTSL